MNAELLYTPEKKFEGYLKFWVLDRPGSNLVSVFKDLDKIDDAA